MKLRSRGEHLQLLHCGYEDTGMPSFDVGSRFKEEGIRWRVAAHQSWVPENRSREVLFVQRVAAGARQMRTYTAAGAS
jgi:hypothetical protein